MKRSYKLKISPKTYKYLKKVRREYKVKVSVGDIQDFDIKTFDIPEAAGYFFTVGKQKHIYVNNKQMYKNSHDLVVLHEIGHMLMHCYHFFNYLNQEESFANGFALAKATEMGLKVNQDMILLMSDYSEKYFLNNRMDLPRRRKRK